MSPPAAAWHRESEEEKAIEFGFSGHGLLDPTADDHRNGRLADEAARGRPWLARREVHDWHVQGREHPQDRRAPAARLAVVAAIGYGGYLFFGPVPRASDEPPDSTHDLETLCWYQRRYYPTVDAYQGPAPHPIQIFEESDSQVSDPGWSPARVRQSLPKHWNRKHDDPTSVQLVACVEIADEGPRIGECRFRGRPIPMYQGRYRATLYEVRTGEKVAEVDDILGRKDFEESMCPAMHVWREDKEPRLLSTPDAAEYQRVFGRYVDG